MLSEKSGIDHLKSLPFILTTIVLKKKRKKKVHDSITLTKLLHYILAF